MSNESSNQTAQQPAAAMSDRQAVTLAQASAFAHCNDHPYLPQTHQQASTWQPHEWVVAAIQTAALISSHPAERSFQAEVADWMGACFTRSLYSDMTERGDRLLEEVLELLQAHGYDSARVPTLVNYVFGRPVGEPAQEVGGVMVTLAAYCSVAGLSMQADGQAELDRINQPEVMARIRAKQAAKNALHFDTPLPGSAAQPFPAGQGDALVMPACKPRAMADDLPGYYESDRDWMTDRENAVAVRWFIENSEAIRAALAARQPVGQEPVAWFVYWSDMSDTSPELARSASRIAEVSALAEPPRIVPLYAAPPAQAVDLGQFRTQVAELLRREFDLEVPDPEDHRHDDGAGDADRIAGTIAALIDTQAGREPNNEANRLTGTKADSQTVGNG